MQVVSQDFVLHYSGVLTLHHLLLDKSLVHHSNSSTFPLYINEWSCLYCKRVTAD